MKRSTWVLALSMHHVSNSSAAVKLVLPFKDGIASVTCLGFNSPLAVSPPSAITTSPGLRCLKLPHSLKICTSLISPSNKSETKHAPLFGVTAIRHFKILQCLLEEKVLPCLAKFLQHSILNSVQSTVQYIFVIALKTFGMNTSSEPFQGTS